MFRDFSDVMKELRLSCGYSLAEATEGLIELGIAVNRRHITRWENGHNQPNIEQFIGLCRLYGVKDVYRVFGKHDFTELLDALNKEGQQKVEEYKRLLVASGMYTPTHCENAELRIPRTAPLFSIGVSAGTGQFLDSDNYEMIEVPDYVPANANFGVHVSGDSMQPTLHDGDIIWIQMQPTLENGEIGVFVLDGDAFVKELRKNEEGVFLVSHNTAYPPRRITDYNEAKVYGKMVYPRF